MSTETAAQPSAPNRLVEHLRRCCGLYAIAGVVTAFVALVCRALAAGGRWDLYDAVAMGDRVGGHFAYSLGAPDHFMPTTPYFLGVSVISFLAGKISAAGQVTILLVLATTLVFVLLATWYRLYRRLGGTETFPIYLGLGVTATVFCLDRYLDYALEFKPDTPSLIFFGVALGVLLSDMALVRRLSLTVVLIALAMLFKQQIAVPIAAMGLGLLLRPGPLPKRFAEVAAVGIGGLIGLAIDLMVPNAVFFAVISHMGRQTVKLLDIHHAILFARIAVLVVLVVLVRKPAGVIAESLRVGRIWPYSLACIAWLLVCIAGARNYGGNEGNTAVGFMIFMPFAVLLLDKADRWLKSLIFIALIVFSLGYLGLSGWHARLERRLAVQDEIAQALVQAHAGKVLASGDSYVAVRQAGVPEISEIDAWAHIHNGVSRDKVVKTGPELLDELQPDAIVCLQGCWVFKKYNLDPGNQGYQAVILPHDNSPTHDVLFIKSK